jgi:hypothetical protein
MANERYAEKAVVSPAAYLRANLAAQLDAIETEQALTSGVLVDPVEFLEANAPDDNRSPIVEVFVASGSPEHERERLYSFGCGVALSYSSDADIAAGERMLRRYYTGVLKTLQASSTLGGTVQHAQAGAVDFLAERGSDATTRHTFVLDVEVRVNDA